VLPGIIGTLQAIEAVKLILGIGEPLNGRLLHFDALAMRFRQFNLKHDPQCPVCGDSPTITEPIDYQQFCGLPSTDAGEVEEHEVATISVTSSRNVEGQRQTNLSSWMFENLSNTTSATSQRQPSSHWANCQIASLNSMPRWNCSSTARLEAEA
jgi:hypothetical protein